MQEYTKLQQFTNKVGLIIQLKWGRENSTAIFPKEAIYIVYNENVAQY